MHVDLHGKGDGLASTTGTTLTVDLGIRAFNEQWKQSFVAHNDTNLNSKYKDLISSFKSAFADSLKTNIAQVLKKYQKEDKKFVCTTNGKFKG